MKEELTGLLSTMGLTLSEEKTKVTHITEGFIFLGYKVIRNIGTKGTMISKVLIPEEAIKQFRYKIREMLAPNTVSESMKAKIIALNRLTRGWCEYYRCTNSPSQVFGSLSNELFWLMAHWLGRKYKSTIKVVIRRHLKGNTFGTRTTTLIWPGEYKAKRFVARTWHNPYTEKENVEAEKVRIKREIFFSFDKLWAGTDDRKGQSDLREELLLTKGTTCAICGIELHPSEVEMDHITPRAKFKNPIEADRMGNLQPLCTPCHRAKTQIDRKVLSRMR